MDICLRSQLITLRLHLFDLQITLRRTLYIQPQNPHERPHKNIQNLEKPIDLMQRFTFGISPKLAHSRNVANLPASTLFLSFALGFPLYFLGYTYSRRSQGNIAAERQSLYSFRWTRKCFSTPPPNQIVDIFTKSVSQPLFKFFRSKLHVCSSQTLSLQEVLIFSTKLYFPIYIIFDILLNANIFLYPPIHYYFHILVIYLIINRELSHTI